MPRIICSRGVFSPVQGVSGNLTVGGLLTVNGNSTFTNNLTVNGTVSSTSIPLSITDFSGLTKATPSIASGHPILPNKISEIIYDGSSAFTLSLPSAVSGTKCCIVIDRPTVGTDALTINCDGTDTFTVGCFLPSRDSNNHILVESIANQNHIVWTPSSPGNDFLGRGSYFVFGSKHDGKWDVHVHVMEPQTGTGNTGTLIFEPI